MQKYLWSIFLDSGQKINRFSRQQIIDSKQIQKIFSEYFKLISLKTEWVKPRQPHPKKPQRLNQNIPPKVSRKI